jgi:hypothetical protein
MLGGSRVVALQPHTDSVEVLYESPAAEPFYTERMGKWQRLANGNLLLTEAQAGRILEVSPSGEKVWEWIHEPADERRVAEVSEGTRYAFTPDQVSRWPCSSAAESGEVQ